MIRISRKLAKLVRQHGGLDTRLYRYNFTVIDGNIIIWRKKRDTGAIEICKVSR